SGIAGDKITITGTGFTNATKVTFGGTDAASFTVKDATTIEAVLATGSSTGKVAVTTPAGSGSSSSDFTFFGVGSRFDVRGIITTNTTWKKDFVYRIRGYVYVTNNVTLTIEPGTKIISNKDSAGVLIITPDSKIIAEGTASAPIVFTSAENNPAPGDFGGVVIAGNGKWNGNHLVIEGGLDVKYQSFGGNNDADNSGTLKYVRIEYAGKAVNPGDEVNGLSLYGVGSGTTIDYVQISRGYDDGLEIFGGAVNLKHVIVYNTADDDFDFDDGYRGMIQYAISFRDPSFTDPKGTSGDVSNNFEVDNVNPSNGFTLSRAPITFPVMSNFTAVGPNNAAGTSADYGWGMRWRRGAKFVLANSVVIGAQREAFRIQEDSSISYFLNGSSQLYNCYIHDQASKFAVSDKYSASSAPYTIPNFPTYDLTTIRDKYKSTKTTEVSDYTTLKLTDPFKVALPNLNPQSGSPLLSGGDFTPTALTNAFFDKVTFVGAIGTTDWTVGWTKWGL
ncbi:MAG: hypothetical protein EBU73_07410, partial [Chitinophagia bacterium]|nr:hypothetical protein [Chitinophagia bacterium]